jgi:hypothetical protein
MVQASGRYKACDNGATEKPRGRAVWRIRPRPRSRPRILFLFKVQGWLFFVEDEDEAGTSGIAGPVFASIAPGILFKLDACQNRRHARW